QFIRKKPRLAVYSYIFQEGVLVAKKDFYQQSHEEVEGATNLEVLMLMKSLRSRGYVRETFNWQYYYYYLTEEGIDYLRMYLHLPEEIIPATLQKSSARPARAGPVPGTVPKGPCERPGGRFDKMSGEGGGDFNPEFQGGQDGYRRSGGFGRGGGN
ncbi:unnamed protein product, partial [Chrysoparadoxa australica]